MSYPAPKHLIIFFVDFFFFRLLICEASIQYCSLQETSFRQPSVPPSKKEDKNLLKLFWAAVRVKKLALESMGALVINVVAAVSAGNVPLNAVQILCVNLIMDTLGALALATEPPKDHLMRRPPGASYNKHHVEEFVNSVTVLLILNFRGRSILGLEHESSDHAFQVKNTLIFNAFVPCQIFNEFNARKPDEINVWKGVTKNSLFMGIVLLEVVLHVVIILFLGKFTFTVLLRWELWLVSVAIGFIRLTGQAELIALEKVLKVDMTPAEHEGPHPLSKKQTDLSQLLFLWLTLIRSVYFNNYASLKRLRFDVGTNRSLEQGDRS
ncbi:calcium-transporting ATPase 8 plasma membrane-type [Phtheirospermum japonicum]|uniref:Calcium-transporting ATPase 8 plasma membrane-type n=1 Tax=Phtheirospermum japonicum TaxID=374723 RepID=A0A830CCG0_9LAMI|nr:calcium-transporting ATPase 8 plasma membrane-type [Phtheirospermum japonicum]